MFFFEENSCEDEKNLRYTPMQIHCGGKYFAKTWGSHKGILHQKLDHPRKLSGRLTAGKLYVSDSSIEVLTILEKEETKMKGQL